MKGLIGVTWSVWEAGRGRRSERSVLESPLRAVARRVMQTRRALGEQLRVTGVADSPVGAVRDSAVAGYSVGGHGRILA